mmetsp:Transcript_45709/g.60583  ORF Transcript_45709/g.60583 Transcript_45709/m.60583 type:complete len:126 (+) Transcript_45709:55-432(+)
MGDFWYPVWYRPRYGRLLGMLNYKWGTFPPLVSMRDRHCEIQYKGPVYARTLWTVQSWTDEHQARAALVSDPLHLTVATKDRVVSPSRCRQFYDNLKVTDKVKVEHEVGHEVLANHELKDSVVES